MHLIHMPVDTLATLQARAEETEVDQRALALVAERRQLEAALARARGRDGPREALAADRRALKAEEAALQAQVRLSCSVGVAWIHGHGEYSATSRCHMRAVGVGVV